MFTILGLLGCVRTAPAPADDTDDACTSAVWHPDADGDTYGDPGGAAFEGCEPPGGFVSNAGDCDDADPAVHPDATELCDGLDQDCDGAADSGVSRWYTDADGDGFGDAATELETCEPPTGLVADGTDCDDADPAVHPGAEEACDGDDDDCDGVADLGEIGTWHSDVDADGYGSAYDGVESCTAPEPGYTLVGGDCQPFDATVFPGAVETCNDTDDDCDGDIDEDFERDGDGAWSTACEGGTDCDDGDADTHPDAVDVCDDGVDQDCSGQDRICGFDTTIDLSTLPVLYGAAGDDVGRQMKVGDVDGDGVDDLCMATLFARGNWGGGFVYPGGTITSGELDTLAWRVASDSDSWGAGRSLGVGDMDGDGVGDLAFGAPYPEANGMRVLLGPIGADAEVSDGVWLYGESGTFTGHGVDVGDINGDGVEDAVVGAYRGWEGDGGVYVSYGPLTGDVDLSTADVQLIGEGGYSGRWIRADGDYNGDGVSDVLLSAPYGDFAAPLGGAAYMVYGPPAAEVDLSVDFDGRYLGVNTSEYAGIGLGEGDVDGDGRDDVLVGSNYSAYYEGAAYVYLGPAAGDRDTTAYDIAVIGAAGDSIGVDLIAQDLNGDGDGELIVGGLGPMSGAWMFADLASGTYTTTDGISYLSAVSFSDQTGTSVQVGDLDADGLWEVMVGAPAESTNGAGAGAVYVVEYAE